MAEISYQEMISRVSQVYGTDVTFSQIYQQYPAQGSEIAQMINNAGVSINYSSSGNVISYTVNDIKNTANTVTQVSENIGSLLNSNTGTVTNLQGGKLVGSIKKVTDSTGTWLKGENGVQSLKTAAKSPGSFVLKEVAPAVAAAGVGITLGKTIDKALYNANPNFWDSKGMSTLNPETWNNITSDYNGVSGSLFNLLFGLNPENGETQAYLDENALAYLTGFMQSKGLFNVGGSYVKNNEVIESAFPNLVGVSLNLKPIGLPYTIVYSGGTASSVITNDNVISGSVNGIVFNYANETAIELLFYSAVPFVIGTQAPVGGSLSSRDYTINGKTVHYLSYFVMNGTYNNYTISTANDNIITSQFSMKTSDLCWMCLYGELVTESVIDGVTNQENATQYDPTGITPTDTTSVLEGLKRQFPQLWDNAVTNSTINPNTGEQVNHIYVPIGTPNGVTNPLTDIQPTTNIDSEGNTQAKPQITPKEEPNPATKSLLDWLIPFLTPTPTDNPPDTGKGHTPAIVPPVGTASALWTVYNPSQSAINEFGAWLWSSNFVDQLKKLFNDPMSAIIGLHKVFCTPSTGGTQNIKVGYLDSGVPSAVVTNQYTTINCGSVNVPEYFGNVLDYSPHTRISMFLPFIGIVPLNVSEVMRSTVSVIYHVDVLTGACLAEIKVQRDGNTANLYTYSGNASVQYPLSSGTYMGIVTGALGIAGGIAGTIASGGALMPMLMGAGASVGRMQSNVQHSGNITGNAGAMGGKIPYLIINRPQTHMTNYLHSFGNPENLYTALSSCSGFTRVSSIHTDGINATSEEKTLIETALKTGVII